ncbi:Methylesterase 10 [Linum perenne]
MKKQHLVLVHGTNHGAWCWYKLITRLKSAGHKVTALDLGGSGVNFDQVSSIDDYVKLLIQFMAHLPEEERVILVGHSYGGIPISLAMEKFPSKILVAVFVAAFMPSISSPPANVVLEVGLEFTILIIKLDRVKLVLARLTVLQFIFISKFSVYDGISILT